MAKFQNFIGTSAPSRSSSWNASRSLNFYPEVDEGGAAKDPRALIGTPGIVKFSPTLPTLPTSPLRCLWAGYNRLFAVAGSKFYEVFADGTYTDRGDVGDDTAHSRAQIFANGTEVMIVSAGLAFIDTGVTLIQPTFNIGGSSYTDLVATSAFTVTSAAEPFTNLDVNTYIQITSTIGGWTGGTRVLIISVDPTTHEALLSSPVATPGSVGGHAKQDFGVVQAAMGAYIDGYFIVLKPNSNNFYLSYPMDGTNWDINDTATKEGAPDRLLAIIADHEELWLFGYETHEVWRDTGNGVGGFAFEKDPGAVMQTGIAAPWSAASLAQGVAWLGEDMRGRGVAYRAQGYQPVRISTHAVESAWSTYSTIYDAEAFVYSEGGHEFWVITFPTGNATWVYDATASQQMGSPQWHERTWTHAAALSGVVNVAGRVVTWVSGDKLSPQIFSITIATVVYPVSPGQTGGKPDTSKAVLATDGGTQANVAFTAVTLDRQRQRVHCFAFFKHLVGDWQNGNVYEQNLDTYDDNGVSIVGRRTASPLSDEEIVYFGKEFYLEMESGDGTCTPVLDWSDDRGKTFGMQHVGFGTAQDAYSTRFPWRRIGKWRHRTFRITITEAVKRVITAADLDVEKGLF
jgi:hypothetical protein